MEIPHRIKMKIEFGPDFDQDCWHWTGYALPAKTFQRLGWTQAGWADIPVNRSAHPRVSHEGESRPAARVLMSLFLGVPYRKLPKIRRTCSDPMCVNPRHHALASRGPIKPRLAEWMPDVPAPAPLQEGLDGAKILALLREAETVPDMGPVMAAEEIGVPHISDEVWAEYLKPFIEAAA